MKSAKLFRTSATVLTAMAMLSIAAPTSMAATSSSTTSTATSWSVDVGPMSKDGIMAMSFFPNVITVDAGDSITFTGAGHTVTFPGPDGKIPSATSPQAQMPAGTNTYDGSTLTSSGLLTGKPYTLTFTKPGVYPYYCVLHPGMMGVVIVNPAGTAYPMTQAQYNAEAQQQEQADYTAGDKAVSTFSLKSKKNSNGTTTYYAQTDAPETQAYSFNLASSGSSKVTGSALIAFAQPPSKTNPNITYNVSAKLAGLTPGQTYTAMLCEGTSGSGVMVPNSKFGTITVNSDGSATVTGSVQASGLPQGIWYLDIYDANQNVVADGLINSPSFAYERFLPDTLHIHPGDTVVWTQTGANEVHTVTFLPKGWSDIPNESMMPVPFGGSIYAGTGFFNSGFMIPGATYQLTFIKSGDYQYRCLLHDVMGMLGTVDVTPQKNVATFALNSSIMDVPSMVKDGTTFVPLYDVEQILKTAGIQSTWNGHDWKMTTSGKVTPDNITLIHGSDHFYINGNLVQNATGDVVTTGKVPTTYVPLYDVQQVLQEVGLHGTWDGSTWDATPSAHAGTVPSGSTAGPSSSSAAGGSSSSTGMKMN